MQLVTSEELNEAHRNQTSEVNDAQTVQLRRRSVTIATLAAEKDEALAAMVAQVHLFHSLSCNCGTSQSRCLTKQRQHAERLLWQFRDPICCRLSSSYSRCFSALSLPPMPLLTQLSLLSATLSMSCCLQCMVQAESTAYCQRPTSFPISVAPSLITSLH